MKKKPLYRGIASLLSVSLALLPLAGWSVAARAANNIPVADQPQVLIIIDNSQGMAGMLQGVNGLSGAIMTGSGVVAANQSSTSPLNYMASGFTPPVTGISGTSVPYTVSCTGGNLTAAAQSACASVANSTGYSQNQILLDNSESMLNVAEQAVGSIINNPNYGNNIQFGLMDYAIQGQPALYDTWVYYMSDGSGFSFGNSVTGATNSADIAVPNPCYGSTSSSCANIQGILGNNAINDKYLYAGATSDDPAINDVLYSTNGSSNFLTYTKTCTGRGGNRTCSYVNPPTINYYGSGYFPNYVGQLNNNYGNGPSSSYSNYSTTPTSAGYLPQSPQVWYSARGYAFNATPNFPQNSAPQGNILVPVAPTTSSQLQNTNQQIYPEAFIPGTEGYSTGYPQIEADAGYSPMAGAFTTALAYYQGQLSNPPAPPPSTCGNKYVILVTDGQPTMGLNGGVYPPLGSAAAQMLGETSITASTTSTNNNAFTETLTAIQNLAQNGIKTYIIGVGSAVNPTVAGSSADNAEAVQGNLALTAMAQAGGTQQFYSATTPSSLQAAMNSIVAQILGNAVTASIGAPPSVTAGSLEFAASDINQVTGEGDLTAYTLSSNGTLSSNAAWDAEGIMSSSNRSTNLFTTDPGSGSNGGPAGSGSEATFSTVASTNSAAFGTLPSGLTASDIANYTVDPSYSSGMYLAGRAQNWFVGLASGSPPAVLTPPDNALLLGGSGTNSYLTFAAQHASRQNTVLFADNDGFLYAIGYNANGSGSPSLLWGWMPQGLLPQLQTYNTFWQGSNMAGGFQAIDAVNAQGIWHTYIVGSAANGGILYDLQLGGTASPMLKGTVWEDDLGNTWSQPVSGAPTIYQVSTPGSNFGQTWALWVVNNTLNGSVTSYLIGVNVGTGASFQDSLPFTASSEAYIDPSANLFIGDNSGIVHEIPWGSVGTNGTATLGTSAFSSLANYAPWASSNLSPIVQYVGGTYYQGKEFLRVQGPDGITIFSQTNGTWSPVWTAYLGGAAIWSSGTYTTQTNGANPGIPSLPAGSTITNPALINSGAVIVPVTVPPSSNSCGKASAYYYLYALNNGVFPSGVFTDNYGNAITGPVFIGYGTAFTPTVTSFNGRTLLQAAANTPGPSGQFPAGFGAGLPLGGPAGWKQLLN